MIADRLDGWLRDPGRLQSLRGELERIRALLGEPGIFDRAADAVLGELDRLRS